MFITCCGTFSISELTEIESNLASFRCRYECRHELEFLLPQQNGGAKVTITLLSLWWLNLKRIHFNLNVSLLATFQYFHGRLSSSASASSADIRNHNIFFIDICNYQPMLYFRAFGNSTEIMFFGREHFLCPFLSMQCTGETTENKQAYKKSARSNVA